MNSNLTVDHLAAIAHDLNGPITAAKGNIELFQLAGPMNDKQQRFSERALGSLVEMEKLVRLLLDLAWLESGHRLVTTDVDVEEVLDVSVTIAETNATRKKVSLVVEVDPSTGSMEADADRLPQIPNNLLTNAIKFNREGGTVWVKARGTDDEVIIVVQDDGRGIPPEDLPHLFERFYRGKPNSAGKIDGTGLGLAIVKGVVDKHHGTITVESVHGEGTTFTVTLPRKQPPAPPAEGGERGEADAEPATA